MSEDMTGDELRTLRGERSAQEFGAEIARLLGNERRPYTAQEVWNWENELRPVPKRVAAALRRDWLFVPYEDGFLIRMACPICGARNPKIMETSRNAKVEFPCGNAELLNMGTRRVTGRCKEIERLRPRPTP